MKLFSVIRSKEWWEYKLPPLLAIGYATTHMAGQSLYHAAPWFLFLLAALVTGAVYVSLVNDMADREEDLASGKTNRMARFSKPVQWLLISLPVAVGLIFAWFLAHDRLSVFLYGMSWIAFSLYSLPPIRLKTRGGWGVLADACGAHFFTSLLMVSSTSYFTGQPIDWIWFAAVGVWSLVYGLRGILWHQFYDRENDLRGGLNTYASSKDPELFKKKSRLLMLIELAAMGVMLSRMALPLAFLGLLFYLILILIRYKKYGARIIVIIAPAHRPFQILMGDYYQVFLPLALMIAAALVHPAAWMVLALHLLLFPEKIKAAFMDMFRFVFKK